MGRYLISKLNSGIWAKPRTTSLKSTFTIVLHHNLWRHATLKADENSRLLSAVAQVTGRTRLLHHDESVHIFSSENKTHFYKVELPFTLDESLLGWKIDPAPDLLFSPPIPPLCLCKFIMIVYIISTLVPGPYYLTSFHFY